MEKYAHALIKALKEFRVYILHFHTIVYVPSVVIKEILRQVEPNGKRVKWIATLLEYDLEVKPTKLVKGQGLAKLMAQSNCEVIGMNFFVVCSNGIAQDEEKHVQPNFLASSWYKDTIYVLQNLQAPLGLTKT